LTIVRRPLWTAAAPQVGGDAETANQERWLRGSTWISRRFFTWLKQMHLDIAAEDPGMMRRRWAQRVEASRKHLNDSAALLVDGHTLDVLKQRGHHAVAIRGM
jgi:hypothetical protein